MDKKNNRSRVSCLVIACFLLLALPSVVSAQAPWTEYRDVIGDTMLEMVDARKDANAYLGLLETAREQFFNNEPGSAEHKQATEDLKVLLWRRDVIFLISDLQRTGTIGVSNAIRSLALEQSDLRMKGSPAEQRFNEWKAALIQDLQLGPNEKLWSLDDPQVQQAFNHTAAAYSKYSAAAFDWEWAQWCDNPRGSKSTLKKCESITGVTMAQREAKKKAEQAEVQRTIKENAPKIAAREEKAQICRDDAWSRGLRGQGASMYVDKCFNEGAQAITEQDLAKYVIESDKAKIQWARMEECKPLMPRSYGGSTLNFSRCMERNSGLTIEVASARVEACNCRF